MKRTISLILAFILVMAVAPLNAFAAESDKLVKNIEITIDTRIAGKTPSECADFLTVGGEGVKLDCSTFKAYYTDGHFNSGVKEAEMFEEGRSYSSYIYIYPEEGYALPRNTQNVNIKYTVIREVGEFDGSFTVVAEDENPDDGSAIRYKVLIHYAAEKQVPTGAAKIPYLIGKFFGFIADLFTTIFIAPISELISMII